MKNRIATLLFGILIFFGAHLTLGQAWIKVGSMNGAINFLSPFNGKLIACGTFDGTGENPAIAVAQWDGNTWSQVGDNLKNSYPNQSSCNEVIDFNGTLFVSGSFNYSSSTNIYNFGASFLNGTSWADDFMTSGAYFCLGAQHMCVYNGELYTTGDFCNDADTCGYANFIARWNGSAYEPVDRCPTNNNSATTVVNALAVNDGKLFMGISAYRTSNGTYNILASLDGSKFTILDSAYYGYGNEITTLAGYKSFLYTFNTDGVFFRWTGIKWDSSAVNKGLVNQQYSKILGVFNNYLFASVGGLLGRWNGSEWTTFNNLIQSPVCMTFYNGHYYGGGFDDGVYQLNDSVFNAVIEHEGWNSSGGISKVIISPVPAESFANIGFDVNWRLDAEIVLYNQIGAPVMTIEEKSLLPGHYSRRVERGSLPSGVYHLMFSSNNQLIVKKVVFY
jgi:hypothetical protein